MLPAGARHVEIEGKSLHPVATPSESSVAAAELGLKRKDLVFILPYQDIWLHMAQRDLLSAQSGVSLNEVLNALP